MEAIRLETTIEQDGLVPVPGLKAGEEVEITVVRTSELKKRYPLQGTGGRFDNPFDPLVADEEWGDVFSGTEAHTRREAGPSLSEPSTAP